MRQGQYPLQWHQDRGVERQLNQVVHQSRVKGVDLLLRQEVHGDA
jgi:hypothetical protein